MTEKNIAHNEAGVNCTDPILQAFLANLPLKPYCTDSLGALAIRPKATAAQKAYIQPNPVHRQYWLVYDLDYPARKFWQDEDVPTPNISAGNRQNDHQHLFYLLDPAVFTLQNARQKPLELAADVDRGLTALLKADPAYGKLIAKNPLHPRWETNTWYHKEWTLNELVELIPRSLLKRKAKAKEEIGLGRNCTVFEKTRHYAYSEWRRLKFGGYPRLFEEVFGMALNVNSGFLAPMTTAEVKCITRSVCKWTAKHLTKDGFQQWGDMRRNKSIAKRQSKSAAKAAEAKALYAEGRTQAQIALIMGINQSQVSRLLRY